MFRLFSGIFLGWSLGANDAANVFGTAVASRVVRFSVAAAITAVFVIAGAVLQGAQGMRTLSNLTAQDLNTAFISTLAAALTTTVMTILALPVSTSQAMVGAILGIGLTLGQPINWNGLNKVAICWIGTPVGAMMLAFVLYHLFRWILGKFTFGILTLNAIIKYGLLFSGAYGAYALGANNVANVTGVFAAAGLISVAQATLIGSISIMLGVVTFGKRVMLTVGGELVHLDGFSAFVAVLAQAITVHIYAEIGVPVSTSQAIIGAVLGIGMVMGMKTVNLRVLLNIFIGWISTPVISGFVAFAILKIWALLT